MATSAVEVHQRLDEDIHDDGGDDCHQYTRVHGQRVDEEDVHEHRDESPRHAFMPLHSRSVAPVPLRNGHCLLQSACRMCEESMS